MEAVIQTRNAESHIFSVCLHKFWSQRVDVTNLLHDLVVQQACRVERQPVLRHLILNMPLDDLEEADHGQRTDLLVDLAEGREHRKYDFQMRGQFCSEGLTVLLISLSEDLRQFRHVLRCERVVGSWDTPNGRHLPSSGANSGSLRGVLVGGDDRSRLSGAWGKV